MKYSLQNCFQDLYVCSQKYKNMCTKYPSERVTGLMSEYKPFPFPPHPTSFVIDIHLRLKSGIFQSRVSWLILQDWKNWT